jgi:hypothetical protein
MQIAVALWKSTRPNAMIPRIGINIGSADMSWEKLLEAAANVPMTDEEKAKQRLSFAYGNTHIENAHITREMVAEEADKIDQSGGWDGSRK